MALFQGQHDVVIAVAPRLAEHRTQHRREHHGHQQRGQQRRRQRDRQILHELADHAGPENQRQEHDDGDRQRAGDRPGHGAGRGAVGVQLRQALDHLAVGILHQHDRAIHQHAGGEDQAEQHDHIDGQARQRQRQDADQEGGGDGDAHQHAAAESERADDDDHDQQDGEDQAALQLVEHVLDVVRAVAGIGHLDLRRPMLRHALGFDHGADLRHGVDDVLARAL